MLAFTIGTSTHDWSSFQRLLDRHRIGCLVDVRSYPRSRLTHFNRPILRVSLNRVGISYVHLGDQLGGRPRSGSDRYDDMAQTPDFLAGIVTLLEMAPRTRLVLCCAEHDVITCHRFLLVGRHLAQRGVDLHHIARDGSLETQHDAEERLLTRTKVQADLLQSRDERLAEAYHRQEQRLRGEPA
ncbi:DUF488 domain-containing protein [Devosia sp. A369]